MHSRRCCASPSRPMENDMKHLIELPTQGANLADYKAEGRRWGRFMAKQSKKLTGHAEKLGVLTEQTVDNLITPGLLKDFKGVLDQLRLQAGASDEQVRAFDQAAREEFRIQLA